MAKKSQKTSGGSSHPLIGKVVPKFALQASNGVTFDSKSLRGSMFVLYFHPKADTPGCTAQACGFRDAIASYRKLGVPVFGISPDSARKVLKFAEKFAIPFPLLADADHAVCEQFGVWVEKTFWGRKYWGAARSTFVIDARGKVVQVFENVKPDGHDQEVLNWLKSQC